MLAGGALLARVLHPPNTPHGAGGRQLPVGFLPAGGGRGLGACPAAWGRAANAARSPTKMLLVMGCGSASISGCPAQMNTLGSAGEGRG